VQIKMENDHVFLARQIICRMSETKVDCWPTHANNGVILEIMEIISQLYFGKDLDIT